MFDPRLLVGYDSSDDACVYSVSDDVAVIETVDFFTPIVDDPYLFGQIAAANALSDVYAMGGVPKLAMNLLCVPSCLPLDTVRAILEGGHDKAVEAGCVIAGGHTIQDDEPKYGLCVTGFVHPQHILKNIGAQPGDVLVLTKALGVGDIWPLIEGDIENLRENLGDYYPSMAQDAVIHHRRTEIDVLNGAIARYGERLGVPTPYNRVLADIVSCVQDNYNNQYGMENG